MRLEISSDLNGTRVRDAHILDEVRQLQAALESSRQELAELSQTVQGLRDEWRKLLEAGSAAPGYQNKLTTLLSDGDILNGRIRELERLLATRTSLVGSEIAALQTDLMHACYGAQEEERAQLEAAFFSAAGNLIKRLVRLKKLSEVRGHSMQAFRRRVGHGLAGDLVREFLAEPAAELATSFAESA